MCCVIPLGFIILLQREQGAFVSLGAAIGCLGFRLGIRKTYSYTENEFIQALFSGSYFISLELMTDYFFFRTTGFTPKGEVKWNGQPIFVKF